MVPIDRTKLPLDEKGNVCAQEHAKVKGVYEVCGSVLLLCMYYYPRNVRFILFLKC